MAKKKVLGKAAMKTTRGGSSHILGQTSKNMGTGNKITFNKGDKVAGTGNKDAVTKHFSKSTKVSGL
jgi:hypothetical protein